MSNQKPIVESISYSGLTNWQYCPFYYKLVNVDKLRSPNTVWTHWGTLIHKYVQDVLRDKINPDVAAARFKRTWLKFCSLYKEDYANIADVGALTVRTIKDRFQKEFGDFEVLFVEKRIQLPNGFEWPQIFKGFVDIGILVKKTNTVVVADFKSCKSAFFWIKYKDKYKDYQLTLYKHFLSQNKKLKLDPKNTETYFVLLERNEKSKNPISFAKVSSGPRKIQNALDWMKNSLFFINKQKWMKNKSSCLKYGLDHPCRFFKTEHCS